MAVTMTMRPRRAGGLPAALRQALRRARELAAGVVDEHVDGAEALEHAPDERAHLLGLADVAALREHLARRRDRIELGARGGELLLVAAAHGDVGAEQAQLLGGVEADAAPAAGDDADLPLEEAGSEYGAELAHPAGCTQGSGDRLLASIE
jgi:hypothetical protein